MEALDMGNLSPLKHFEIQWETGEQNDNSKGPFYVFVVYNTMPPQTHTY